MPNRSVMRSKPSFSRWIASPNEGAPLAISYPKVGSEHVMAFCDHLWRSEHAFLKHGMDSMDLSDQSLESADLIYRPMRDSLATSLRRDLEAALAGLGDMWDIDRAARAVADRDQGGD